jgi:cephalosporin hydroxylase
MSAPNFTHQPVQEIFFPDPIDEAKMDYSYFGCSMQQNRYALPALSTLLKYAEPSRIIEFGTRFGGLAVFLGMYSKNHHIPFHTFDIENQVKYRDYFTFLGIHFHERDIFSPDTRRFISGLINQNGRTILLCDAIKVKEFNYYADYLKVNDIILAHDYAQDKKDFDAIRQQRIWWCCEITYKDIEETCRRNNLMPVFASLFRTAAWCCFIKK